MISVWADPTVRTFCAIGIAIVAACALAWLSGYILQRAAARRRRYRRLLLQLHRSCRRAWIATLLSGGIFGAVSATVDGDGVWHAVRHGLLLVLLGTTAWMIIMMLFVAEDAALQWLRVDVTDNRRVRRVRTQVSVLRRLTALVVSVCAAAAALMTFGELRTLGASLLFSASVVGAIAGFAAQTTLSNVFAGLQLALTDALRFDDVVVVNGEWGRVEELTLTNVVLRLWDERRLVLPTSYFTTNPFQNWTRNEARILGDVILHLDYSAPLDELRAEARRLVEASPLWDRREWVLQVVDSRPWSMVVRVLASAADAPSSWDLRCELREKLIGFLRIYYPYALAHSPAPVANGAVDADTVRLPHS